MTYAHNDGLLVAVNAANPADAFGSTVDPNYNPVGESTILNKNDYYLYESYQVSVGQYVSEAAWQAKANEVSLFQGMNMGFNVWAVTTNDSSNVYDQNQFDYAWYSALLYGYNAVGWGEYD